MKFAMTSQIFAVKDHDDEIFHFISWSKYASHVYYYLFVQIEHFLLDRAYDYKDWLIKP